MKRYILLLCCFLFAACNKSELQEISVSSISLDKESVKLVQGEEEILKYIKDNNIKVGIALNPETRILKQVEIEDAMMASEITALLMGNEVPPRREYIYKHAQDADLDI